MMQKKLFLSALIAAIATTVLVASTTPAHAGDSVNDPGPFSFETKRRLAVKAMKSATAVGKMIGYLIEDDDGTGNAEWLALANRFERRAQVLEYDASFEARFEYSLGANAIALRLVAETIRTTVAQRAEKHTQPANLKLYWPETVRIAQDKQNALHGEVNDALRALWTEHITGNGGGSWGMSVSKDASVIVFDIHATDRDLQTRMVAKTRELAKAHGGGW